MRGKLFYSHDNDSQIMIRKDKEEVENWTNHLEFINNELNFFIKIESQLIKDPVISKELNDLRRKNAIALKDLYRYDVSLGNRTECDTVDCDTFFLSNHEKSRKIYLGFLEILQSFKITFYSKMLIYTRL
ncbi:hypothetical protein [Galbibacter orientalis]|uniref:Uncharacterized protein n=1 Tax=Galbibacter orientalis DSM 19592 TaxID=926559 RepID=I3C1B2_9FLAO|nr:hypothetical protein [Galbibacter orientalis]EIJ37405.1 hypothetical protein JoomaDRAFT_0348 [Galbibacter orientalis DSM 19592]